MKRMLVAVTSLIGSFLLSVVFYSSFFIYVLPKHRVAVVSILPAKTQIRFFSFILAEKETIFSGSRVKIKTIEMLLYDQEHGDSLNFHAGDLNKFTGVHMQTIYDANSYMEPLPAWSRQIIANSNDNEVILRTMNSFDSENDESGKCDLVSRILNTNPAKIKYIERYCPEIEKLPSNRNYGGRNFQK
ncbi:MAG: hypothetical protein FD128_2773 [Hyphomonadaceae bacterium]|nr:MAG: hypothetical protein FD128_2773 [Hyphomonadaceae bacterium]